MKLRIKRKIKEPVGRRVSEVGTNRAAPIVRYYRPEQRSSALKSSNEGRTHHEKGHLVSDLKVKQSKARQIIKHASQWAVFGAICLLLIINFSLTGASIRVKGSTYPYRTNEEYQSIIDKIIDSRLSFKTKATLSSASLEEAIKKELPEVETATAVIPLAGRRLQVLLDVASPLVRLQLGINQLAVISSSGVVTNENSTSVINATFSDLPSLSMIGIAPKVGTQILTQDEAKLIKLLSSEFDGSTSSRPQVESLEFDVQKREIKVRFKDTLYYAKLTPEQEGRVQVGALQKTINTLKEQGTAPSEYIDVRVEDRVFVR